MLGGHGEERTCTAGLDWLGKEVEAGAPPVGGNRSDEIGPEEARAAKA